MDLRVAILCCTALLPAAACAFPPLITDDTGTQGSGGNQLESGYVRTVDRPPGARVVTHEVPFFYTRGVTDALDLYAGVTAQRIAPDAPGATTRGWTSPVVGAKWRFHEDEGSKLSFAIKPEVRFPVSGSREARGLGSADASWAVDLIATKEFGFGAVHAGLAMERVTYADDTLNAAERSNRYRLSVAPVWDVAEGWKLALDVGVMTNPDRTARARMGYVELGAVWSPGKDLDLAAGIVRNVADGDLRSTLAILSVSWRFR